MRKAKIVPVLIIGFMLVSQLPPLRAQEEKTADEILAEMGLVEEADEILAEIARKEAAPEKEIIERLRPKISLDLKGVDILDVLKLLAQKGKLNIVAGKNVRGRVTIFLKDVDVVDALEIILAANKLAYEKEGKIINVMTDKEYVARYGEKYRARRKVRLVKLEYAKAADVAKALKQVKSKLGKTIVDEATNSILLIDVPERVDELQAMAKELDAPIVTKIFSLNYAVAKDLKEKLNAALTKNVGSLSIDERTNKVAITDLPKKMEELEKIIAAYDEKHREVMIDAKIYQIILSDDYKQGVNWNLILKTALSTHPATFDLKSTFNILSTNDPGGRLTVGPLAEGFEGFIELLNAIGKTDLLSSPHITAVNNQEAKILVGTTQPYVTQTVTTPGTGPTVTAEEVKFVDVGIKLFVTPTINEDNFITMKIKPEVSSVTGFLTTAQKNEIPIVDTSTVETTVMVKDGTTILLAGLIKDESIDTINKVPFLGDLPVVNFAFRKRHLDIDKKELIVLLTPHVVTGDKDIVPMSAAARPDKTPVPKTIQKMFGESRVP